MTRAMQGTIGRGGREPEGAVEIARSYSNINAGCAQAPAPPPPQTKFLESVSSRLSELIEGFNNENQILEGLADRVYGSLPQTQGEDKAVNPVCIENVIFTQLNGLSYQLHRLNENRNRLNNLA